MGETRDREPNQYELRAEGYAFELHRNVTGQWVLTYNGRTWTQEQFAQFAEAGPLGMTITLETTEPGTTERSTTVTLLVPIVLLPEAGLRASPCDSLFVSSSVAEGAGAASLEGQIQTYRAQRVTGTASRASAD